jgi:hypothetical protein
MDIDHSEYTDKSARLAGEYLFAGLIAFGLLIFSLLVGSDCYFSKGTYSLWIATVVASCLLFAGIIVWGKRLQSGGDISSVRKAVGVRYIMLALYAPFLVYGVLSLLVFLTSRHPLQVITYIHAAGSGRGCRMYYEFYNEPTDRSHVVCRDKFLWAARSGDRVIAIEKVGPLGARIESFQRQPE